MHTRNSEETKRKIRKKNEAHLNMSFITIPYPIVAKWCVGLLIGEIKIDFSKH